MGDSGKQELALSLSRCSAGLVLPDLSPSRVELPHFPRNKACQGPPGDLLGSSPAAGSHIGRFQMFYQDHGQATVELSLRSAHPVLPHPASPQAALLSPSSPGLHPSGEASFLFAFYPLPSPPLPYSSGPVILKSQNSFPLLCMQISANVLPAYRTTPATCPQRITSARVLMKQGGVQLALDCLQ